MADLDARWRAASAVRPGMAVYRDAVTGRPETPWIRPAAPEHIEVPIPNRRPPEVSECYLDTTRRRWQPRWRWVYVRAGQALRQGYAWDEKAALAAIDRAGL